MRTTFLRPTAVAGRPKSASRMMVQHAVPTCLPLSQSHGKRVVEHLHRAGSERSVTWLIGAVHNPASGSYEGHVFKRVWSWTCNVPRVCAVAACAVRSVSSVRFMSTYCTLLIGDITIDTYDRLAHSEDPRRAFQAPQRAPRASRAPAWLEDPNSGLRH